jgi:hypothetical protein
VGGDGDREIVVAADGDPHAGESGQGEERLRGAVDGDRLLGARRGENASADFAAARGEPERLCRSGAFGPGRTVPAVVQPVLEGVLGGSERVVRV